MTLPNSSSGYGWQCPSCKMWFPAGQSHACASYPQTYGYYFQWIDPTILARIAKSLEEISTQLTQRALDGAYCSCENPDVYINRICQLCGLPHAPRQ